LKWKVCKENKGQTEHYFSLFVGVGLILFGIFVLNVTPSENISSASLVNQRIAYEHAERQLVSYLDSRVDVDGTSQPMWKVLLNGKKWLNLDSRNTPYLPQFQFALDHTSKVFNSLYNKDGERLWYVLIRYDNLPQAWIGNAEGMSESCSDVYEPEFIDYVKLVIPGKDDGIMEIELHYCGGKYVT
jgi:hypothetical protein